MRRIGIDETSCKAQHKYLPSWSTTTPAAWSAPARGRDSATLRTFFDLLGEQRCVEFEADLIRLRTRESKGRLRGKQPKLNPRQEAHLVALHEAGDHSVLELGDLFGVTRSTVYRAIERAGVHRRARMLSATASTLHVR